MNKGSLSDQLSESLLPLMSAIQWRGFGGSYSHKPMSTELMQGKDVDILIWLDDKSQSDEILKKVAMLTLNCNVLIHPVLLLDQDKEKYQAIEMYRSLIESVEKIYESQNPQK